MKSTFLIVATLFFLVPSLAHADDRADAILKEVRLRMSYATTYSATLRFDEKEKNLGQIRLLWQRPDKYLFGVTEGTKKETVIVINGVSVTAKVGTDTVTLVGSEGKNMIKAFIPLISGTFSQAFPKGIKSTRYVTQKLLDATTVVDVIDVTGDSPNDTLRVYVDNNSLIRKITGVSRGKKTEIDFLDPVVDQPILASTFALK